MNMPRRILVATDFSADAQRAALRAAGLAAATGSELVLLHVVSTSLLPALASLRRTTDDAARDQAEAAARDALQALAATLADTHGIQARQLAVSGSVAASIATAADELDCDLLVLGARGDNPVRDFLLGSNIERVLRKSRRALLAVRGDAAWRHVLVPVDFSVHAQVALQLAGTLAPQATLTALHVFDAPLEAKLEFAGVPAGDIDTYRARGRRQAEADLLDFLADLPAGLRARVVPQVEVGYAPGVILDTARALGADLIALGKHGRSPVEEWVLGSVTVHVLQNATGDVLVTARR